MFQNSKGLWVERIMVDGKRKEISSKTKSGLKKKLIGMANTKKHSTDFSVVAEEWMEQKSSEIAYNTMQAYRPHVQRAVDYFGSDSVTDITPAEIQAFIDHLANSGYAKDTVHRALVVLGMIFDHAILMPDSELRFNPCAAVKVPRGLKKTRREPPTTDQLALIRPDTEFGLFAWFLLYTGLRRGELLALRWEDIDRENKLIHVSKSVYFEGNKPVIKAPKTENSKRDVELLDILAEALPENRKHGYIFGGNEPLTLYQFKTGWTEWCWSVGLAEEVTETHTSDGNKHTYTKTTHRPLVTCHQFRHEYATMLEEAGITEFNAKNALGHSSISVTKDIYTHIRNRKQSRIGDQLNDFLSRVE